MIVHKTHFSVVDLQEAQILGVEEAVVGEAEAECNRLDYSILEMHEGRTHWWSVAWRRGWMWQIAMRGLLKTSD